MTGKKYYKFVVLIIILFLLIPVKIFADNAYDYWEKGSHLAQQQKYQEAKIYLSEAIELAPDDAIYRNWLGYCFFQLKKYKEANEQFNKATQISVKEAWYYWWGKSIFNTGDYVTAKEIFEIGLKYETGSARKEEMTEKIELIEGYLYYFSEAQKFLEQNKYNAAIKSAKTAFNYIESPEVNSVLNKAIFGKKKDIYILVQWAFLGAVLILIFILLRIKHSHDIFRKNTPQTINDKVRRCEFEQAYKLYKKFKSLNGNINKIEAGDLIIFFQKTNRLSELMEETFSQEHYLNLVKRLIFSKYFNYAYRLYEKYKKTLTEFSERTGKKLRFPEIDGFSPQEIALLFENTVGIEKLAEDKFPAKFFAEFIKSEMEKKDLRIIRKFWEKFRQLNGELTDLSPEIIFEICKNSLGELVNEKLPYNYFLYFAQKFYDEGNIKNALKMLKSGKFIFEFTRIEEFKEFIEIYNKAGKIEEIPDILKKSQDKSNRGFTEIAKILEDMEEYKLGLDVIKLKDNIYHKDMNPQDYQILFTLSENLDQLDEIDLNKIPVELHAGIIKTLIDKGKDYDALQLLSKKDKTSWNDDDYNLCFKLYLKMDMYELAKELFAEIKTQRPLKDTPSLYYDYGLYCEEAERINEAVKVYKQFIKENLLYKDVIDRYKKLRDYLISEGEKVTPANGKLLKSPKATISALEERVNIVGRFELIKQIGEGGMGIVYEAQDHKLNRTVAVKKLRDELSINKREIKRFIDEAKMVAQLNHPYIVEIYDIIEENNIYYIIYEYVNAPSLETVIGETHRINLDECREILEKVTVALSYSHSKNIVHRDLKPANILTKIGEVTKVMDFGIARRASETVSRRTGETTGTLAYMPPEQHLHGCDKKGDIYSLGVTLYEMLTKELPFPGPDYLVQKERMLYQPATEIVPDLPKEVDKIIGRCLQVDKALRYNSADELIIEFNKLF